MPTFCSDDILYINYRVSKGTWKNIFMRESLPHFCMAFDVHAW